MDSAVVVDKYQFDAQPFQQHQFEAMDHLLQRAFDWGERDLAMHHELPVMDMPYVAPVDGNYRKSLAEEQEHPDQVQESNEGILHSE